MLQKHTVFIPSPPWVIPFVALLLAIAILPLVAPRFWAKNLYKLGVSAVLGLPILFLYLPHSPQAVLHSARDYMSFVVLLGGLYVIAGGVKVDGDLEARPAVNTA